MKTDMRFSSYLAQFFLEGEVFQTKVLEKIKIHILYSITLFFFENRFGYEIILKNIAEPDRPQMTIWHMRIAWWIPKLTNIYLEYVILIAFPLQQWLHERYPVLRYTYTACLVNVIFSLNSVDL